MSSRPSRRRPADPLRALSVADVKVLKHVASRARGGQEKRALTELASMLEAVADKRRRRRCRRRPSSRPCDPPRCSRPASAPPPPPPAPPPAPEPEEAMPDLRQWIRSSRAAPTSVQPPSGPQPPAQPQPRLPTRPTPNRSAASSATEGPLAWATRAVAAYRGQPAAPATDRDIDSEEDDGTWAAENSGAQAGFGRRHAPRRLLRALRGRFSRLERAWQESNRLERELQQQRQQQHEQHTCSCAAAESDEDDDCPQSAAADMQQQWQKQAREYRSGDTCCLPDLRSVVPALQRLYPQQFAPRSQPGSEPRKSPEGHEAGGGGGGDGAADGGESGAARSPGREPSTDEQQPDAASAAAGAASPPEMPSLLTRCCWFLRRKSATPGRPLWTFIPVFYVGGLQGWVYLTWCLTSASSSGFGVNFSVLTLFVTLGFSSMIRAVFTDPGRVPESWSQRNPSKQDIRTLEKKANKDLRLCRRCQQYKPDRTHHCSSCDRCVLKMDHHCPWLNNCVGFRNQKFFLLFIFYEAVSCIFVNCTSLRTLQQSYYSLSAAGQSQQLRVVLRAVNFVFADAVALIFGMSLTMFLLFHLRLIARNMTTIEYMEKSEKMRRTGHGVSPYHIGVKENFVAVFGTSPWQWLIPTATTMGSGVYYPTAG